MAYKAFMGRLTRDPELKTTQGGKTLARFSIAVSKVSMEEEADFVNCVAWDEQADLAMQHFKKGMYVCVTGTMKEREWTGRDGTLRKESDLQAKELFLPKEIQTYAEAGDAELPW